MRFDSQERLTKINETSDVQNRIWRELVKLHAVNKEKPTKKFVGRKGQAAQKKGKKHHPIATRGLEMRSVLGKITWPLPATNPFSWALVRSNCSNSEGT
jgi:hypothetical protein